MRYVIPERFLVPLKRYRGNLHYLLLALYFAVATLPQLRDRSPVDSHVPGWPTWSALCVLLVLTVCASTDYLSRRIPVRIGLVLCGMVAYFGVMWPLSLVAGRIIGLSAPELPAGTAKFGWAFLSANAGVPLVIFALRSSRLLAK